MKGRNFKFVTAAAMAISSIGTMSAHATSITAPAGLAPGLPFYVVFVTNTTTDATSGSLSDYDQIAQGDADANGLGTYNSQTLTWQAVVSSSQDGPPVPVDPYLSLGTAAIDRMPSSDVPVYLPDGTLIADSVSDLWTTGAQNFVDEAADGTTVNTQVWTGTSGNGDKASYFPDYDNTVGGSSSVEYGQSQTTGTGWIDSSFTNDSATELPIYAFTEIVPLPSSAAMGAIGFGLLAAYAATRKLLKLRTQ